MNTTAEAGPEVIDDAETLNFERLATIVANLAQGVLVEDERRHILLVNQQFLEQFGIPATPEQMFGADCSNAAEVSKGLFADPEAFVAGIDRLLAARTLAVNDRLELADGRVFERDYVPIFFQDAYRGHMWAYRDITEQVRTLELVQDMATRDPLTGLYNRRYLTEVLHGAAEAAGHADAPISMALIDVDHFKAVNDEYGHLKGDEVLREIAATLSAAGGDHFVGRWGGEEFAVPLPGVDTLAARDFGERLRTAVLQCPAAMGRTISVGVATLDYATLADDPDQLILIADRALYHSKILGRNRTTHAVELP